MAFRLILGIIAIICAIWVIYDVFKRNKFGTTGKVLWTISAILFSIITAVVYAFARK